jgi:hypothetical protein
MYHIFVPFQCLFTAAISHRFSLRSKEMWQFLGCLFFDSNLLPNR